MMNACVLNSKSMKSDFEMGISIALELDWLLSSVGSTDNPIFRKKEHTNEREEEKKCLLTKELNIVWECFGDGSQMKK